MKSDKHKQRMFERRILYKNRVHPFEVQQKQRQLTEFFKEFHAGRIGYRKLAGKSK